MQKLQKFRKYFLFLALFSASWAVFAQSGIGHSPVSRIGYGLPQDFGMSRNEAIGGCGQAVPDEDYPNFHNPALLHFNRKVNLNMDFRYTMRILRQENEADYRKGAALPVLLSFTTPVFSRLSAGIGIRPFSFREFIYAETRAAASESIGIRARGSGGLSQAFLSLGCTLGSGFSIGLEGSYVFGTLEDSITFGVLPLAQNYTFGNIIKRRASQFLIRPGIHYLKQISPTKPVFLAAGASADIGQQLSLIRNNLFAIPGSRFKDTLESEISSFIRRPVVVKLGMGLFAPQHWSLSAELEYAKADHLPAEGNVQYENSLSWRLGAEYRPGINKSTNYLNLITYRSGLSVQNYPFQDAGTVYRDVRFTAGASFPIVRKEAKFSRPILTLVFATGNRGSENSLFGQERYYQVNLGITLNDFLWFNRYKID